MECVRLSTMQSGWMILLAGNIMPTFPSEGWPFVVASYVGEK